jgi:hypothetical protein
MEIQRTTQHLLSEKAAINKNVPIIYGNESEKPVEQIASLNLISPGITD